MAYLIPKPGRTPMEQSYVPAVVEGLGITMRKFFRNAFGRRKDVVTIEYVGPEGPKPVYPERYRGLHRLTQREDGSPRCVACLCCSTACPAQCIYIEPGEYPEGDERFGFERYPVQFVIDELRCVFCGYCVEACPCDAIRMDTGVHAPPEYDRPIFIYDKARLLATPGRDGDHETENPRQDPPAPEESYER
jgi:NADH-quinone oxidoreductase subunit I